MTDLQVDYARRYYDQSYFPGMGAPPPPVLTPPTIVSLAPNTSVVGQPVVVTITGTNFTPTSTVQADGTTLPSVFVSATSITVSGTPLVDGDVVVTVTNADGVSNGVTFTVTLVAGAVAATTKKNGNGKAKAEVDPEPEPEPEPDEGTEDE